MSLIKRLGVYALLLGPSVFGGLTFYRYLALDGPSLVPVLFFCLAVASGLGIALTLIGSSDKE